MMFIGLFYTENFLIFLTSQRLFIFFGVGVAVDAIVVDEYFSVIGIQSKKNVEDVHQSAVKPSFPIRQANLVLALYGIAL